MSTGRGSNISGFTHRAVETSIPDTAEFWMQEADKTHPSRIKATTFKQPHGGTALVPVFMAAAPQALSGAGAVNITAKDTNFTSTGVADALTLADGAFIGQVKQVTHIVDGGSAVLTPATFEDGDTVTFTTVGERWVAIWTGTAWQTVELSNVGDGGGNLPAIA